MREGGEGTMTTSADTRALLTVVEAAARLAIPRTALYRLLMSGELASVKIGRHRRIPAWAIDEFVHRLVDAQQR